MNIKYVEINNYKDDIITELILNIHCCLSAAEEILSTMDIEILYEKQMSIDEVIQECGNNGLL